MKTEIDHDDLLEKLRARMTPRPKGWDAGGPTAKRGSYLETIDYRTPENTPVYVETIGRVLEQLPRFGGHWGSMSIAQHCLHVQMLLHSVGAPREIQMLGLLHDAAEAYTGDICTPFKKYLRDTTPGLRDYLARWDSYVLTSTWPHGFRPITERMHAIVKAADDLAHAQELATFVEGRPAAPELAQASETKAGAWLGQWVVLQTGTGAA